MYTRLYGQYKNRLAETVKSHVSDLIESLDVHLDRFDVDKRGHIHIHFQGPDSEFAANYLTREFGSSISFDLIEEGTILRGTLIDVGKVGYGLYVDVAAMKDGKPVDALIPLYKLRELFKMKKSLRTILSSLVLVDNLPVEVSITHVDRRGGKIEATLAEPTMNRFEKWLHDDHERLLVFGANRSMIETALEKTGHLGDIYEIQELGTFEFVLRCKRSTRASGILAAVGPNLRGIPMHLFIPKEIEEKINA